MNISKMPLEVLKEKENKVLLFIKDLESAMKYIPEESILGRMSIMASIKMKKKRLDEIQNELRKRESD